MFKCLGPTCPGCGECDPLVESEINDARFGGPPMKNITPRKAGTKSCALCAGPVAKRDEAIKVGPHVACLACTFPDGHYSAPAATATAFRIATKHGLSIPEGFAFK